MAGLPIEEWAFFLTVPIACLFTWDTVFRALREPPVRHRPPPPRHRSWIGLAIAFTAAAVVSAVSGREYTSITAAALAIVTGVVLPRTQWHRRWNFWGFLLFVVAATTVFNGYLTGRPVVLYDPNYQLDLRVGTIPIEDYGFGIALVVSCLFVYERLAPRPKRARREAALRFRQRFAFGWVERRLGGYRQIHVHSSPPSTSPKPGMRVAIIGSGIAGLRAALGLARAGIDCQIFEKNDYIGGKIGAWSVDGIDGRSFPVEHGFHAFFDHYYNLEAFLDDTGAMRDRLRIDDYRIVQSDRSSFGYAQVATTPLANLLSLLGHGHLNLRELITRPKLARLIELLRYDPRRSFERLDEVSYAEFARACDLPDGLRSAFNSFARAFFAPPERMSMGELVKSMHFFYFSHDRGLLYDYPRQDYQRALIEPIRRHLDATGQIRWRLSTAVESLGTDASGQFRVHGPDAEGGQTFDAVVLACEASAARRIVDRSADLRRLAPHWCEDMMQLTPGSRYCVWRLWLRQRADEAEHPDFVITDRRRALDSITYYHRFEPHAREWAESRRGSVLELHSYCVPEDLGDEALVREALLDDLRHYLPTLHDGLDIVGESFQLERNFPAFHTGMHARRPVTQSPIPGLVLAGDWVKLPFPAMLMEAACASGILASNAIRDSAGHGREAILGVPQRGLFSPAAEGAAAARGRQSVPVHP